MLVCKNMHVQEHVCMYEHLCMFLCTTRYITHNASAFAEEATKKVSLKLVEFSEPRFYHQFGKQCTF